MVRSEPGRAGGMAARRASCSLLLGTSSPGNAADQAEAGERRSRSTASGAVWLPGGWTSTLPSRHSGSRAPRGLDKGAPAPHQAVVVVRSGCAGQ